MCLEQPCRRPFDQHRLAHTSARCDQLHCRRRSCTQGGPISGSKAGYGTHRASKTIVQRLCPQLRSTQQAELLFLHGEATKAYVVSVSPGRTTRVPVTLFRMTMMLLLWYCIGLSKQTQCTSYRRQHSIGRKMCNVPHCVARCCAETNVGYFDFQQPESSCA